MDFSMAGAAERNKILLSIVSELASGRDVVNFQSCPGTAGLATPAITFQDGPAQCGIFL